MQALIDGDIITYRVGFACQKTLYYAFDNDGNVVDFGHKKAEAKNIAAEKGFAPEEIKDRLEVDPIQNCLHSVKLQLRSIIEETKASSYRLFLTGSGNFRESLVDYYKMNRADAKKPYYYQEIRDYMVSKWNAEVQEGQEADDALSIAQVEAHKFDEETVIVTIDKDLKNTAGNNYNFVKKEWEYISPEEADTNFYSQLIQGDMTDNIPGIYQIAGTRATAKLFEPLVYMDNPKDMWAYVVSVYVDAFSKFIDNNKEAIDVVNAVREKLKETGILLWMRRSEGEIWSPPV